MRRLARVTFKLAGALVACATTLLVALSVFVWVEQGRELTLPPPSGSFAVGRVTDAWIDESRVDAFAGDPATKQELVVWIWYPAARSEGARYAAYLPDEWRAALSEGGVALLRALTRDPARVVPHSVANGELSSDAATYPVVILRAGLAALTANYTTLAENLASHGYVVVGFDAPHRTFVVVMPDGRVIWRSPRADAEGVSGEAQSRLLTELLVAWTGDTQFVVDQLERLNASASSRFHGRLELNAVGVVGHSLGGAVAAQFCHDDPRCGAGVNLDGAPRGSVVQDGLRQPFMFLLSDHGEAADPDSRRISADINSIYERLPMDRRLRLVLKGADHFSFSDQILLTSRVVRGLFRLTGALTLEPRRGLAITAEYVHRFFDVHLKGAPPTHLVGPSPEYPELVFDADGHPQSR
jgi:predicted dienelactone hydrolase